MIGIRSAIGCIHTEGLELTFPEQLVPGIQIQGDLGFLSPPFIPW